MGPVASDGKDTAHRLCDFLQTFAAFTLSEMRSHWGALDREEAESDLHFKMTG